MTPGGVHTEHLLQNYDTGNGSRYILVVPDAAADASACFTHAYAAKTAQPVTEIHLDDLVRH